jgi:sugar-specific transcriptional regulator TrmB
MEQVLRGALTTLGCDDKEARLFLACFTRGSSTLPDLIKTSRLQRSTAYLVMDSLLQKGLVREDHRVYGKTFTALEPEGLMRKLAAKQRQVGRQHLALEERLGELQAIYERSEVRPHVRTYQGVNGLLGVWRDILTAKSEILIWTNQATESKLFDTAQHNQFISERREAGHYARVLAVRNAAGRKLQLGDRASLRETRLLPQDIEFSAETYLYDHKVAVLDYNQDIIGIITESQQVAEAQRAMFETAWQTLK